MFNNLEVYNPDITGYIVTMELAYSFNDEVNEVTIGEFMKRISSYFSIPNDLYPYHPTSIAREGQFSIINKLYISNDKESNIRLQKFVNELKDTYVEYMRATKEMVSSIGYNILTEKKALKIFWILNSICRIRFRR